MLVNITQNILENIKRRLKCIFTSYLQLYLHRTKIKLFYIKECE